MPSSVVYTIKGSDAVVFPKSSIKHSRQDEYLGMVPIRACTDVFFLVAIVAMWCAMSIVGALAIRTGNPYRLVAPMNDQGQLCGPYASSGTYIVSQPSVVQSSAQEPYDTTHPMILTQCMVNCVDHMPHQVHTLLFCYSLLCYSIKECTRALRYNTPYDANTPNTWSIVWSICFIRYVISHPSSSRCIHC